MVLLKQQNDPLASLGAGDTPGGLPLEHVLDPANPDIIDCLAVLKKLAEELEKARPMLAAEGRRADNKTVGDNWTKALKKATVREFSIREKLILYRFWKQSSEKEKLILINILKF